MKVSRKYKGHGLSTKVCLCNQVFLVWTNVRSYVKLEGCILCITYQKLRSG